MLFEVLSRTARTAAPHIKNRYLKVLGPDIIDVFVTQIPMQNRKILCRAWQDVIGAEAAISKTGMLSRRLSALAPLTLDGWLAGHVMA